MTVLSFDVIGIPAPQGSKRAFVVGGKARMTDMGGKRAVAWRDSVANQAKQIADQTPDTPLDGQLYLSISFRFPMPDSRPKRLRELGHARKTTAPDLSKIVRSLEDGLQAGGLITDDARICSLFAEKLETTGWTGATIRIETLDH